MKTTRRGILRALHSDRGNGCLPYGPPPVSPAEILDMHRQHLATELVKIGAEDLPPDRWADMAQSAIDATMILYPETEDDSEKGAPE